MEKGKGANLAKTKFVQKKQKCARRIWSCLQTEHIRQIELVISFGVCYIINVTLHIL